MGVVRNVPVVQAAARFDQFDVDEFGIVSPCGLAVECELGYFMPRA